MNQKTLIAIAAFAALGLVAFFALRAPEKGERASDRPRPVAKVAPGDLDTIEITRTGVTSVVKREGGKFKVAAPAAYQADEANAKAAFEAIEKLELTDLVTEQKTKHAEFEVDDAKGVHVVAKNGKSGKALVDIIVGKTVGSGTMVRPAGKDEVWQAGGPLHYAFDKAPADWRDKSIVTFTLADAEKIDIKAKDGATISLKKTGAKEGNEDKWEVSESSLKIDKLENTVPNGVVSALSALKANDFADGAKPADAGLEPALLTVTVGLKGGKTATALIGGNKTDEDFYVKTPEVAQVFLVKKYAIERLNKRPVEFRDKTLCDVADADLSEIAVNAGDKSFTVVKSGDDWKATKPPKLDVDPAKVKPIANGLRDWKATSFAEGMAPKDAGLLKPKYVIASKAKKGACTVKIGDESKDKTGYYAQTTRSADVYVTPKWTVDRFLVKPDDMKKGAGGPPPPTHARN